MTRPHAVHPPPTRMLERALWALHTHRGDAFGDIERALAEDPASVAAHRLRAGAIVAADKLGARAELAASVAVLEAAPPGPAQPDDRHAAAARAWLAGDLALALARYGAIAVDHPRDLLALVVAHALDFRLGRRGMLRDRMAQVLPEWDAAMPGHASVLAMYAFGLEEGGQYDQAETMAQRALALDRGHPGALHALAHALEMQGRAQEGLALLADPGFGGASTGFAVHLAWHRALFHLELDAVDAALAVHDEAIAAVQPAGRSMLADASALLWRLALRGVDVADRWRTLADRWERQPLTDAGPFFAMHAVMALAADGRCEMVRRVIGWLDDGARRACAPWQTEALPVHLACRALLAFASGDYARCIDGLAEVLHLSHRCGGSLAQCDIVHLTYTEAALRGRQASLARALVAERAARKPGSRSVRRLLARARALAAPVPAIEHGELVAA